MAKQEKFSEEDLAKYRSYVIGMAIPAGEQAGFIGYFGITEEPGPDFYGRLVLVQDYENEDILELVEKLKWLRVYFSFNIDSYQEGGDFIFGDANDLGLGQLLRKHKIRIKHSSLLYNKDAEKPFQLLKPEIDRKRKDDVISIADDTQLALRLKAEALDKPAAIKFGNPAFESLCYAYIGWKELIKNRGRGTGTTISDYNKI